jgi:hypothetical protein
MDKRLGRPQSPSGIYGEEKNLASARIEPIIQPVAHHYTDRTVYFTIITLTLITLKNCRFYTRHIP